MKRVSPEELVYYRGHFREAIREDAVVCLECGSLFRDLRSHLLWKHELLTDEYREHWGYNRNTPLLTPDLHELLRRKALEQRLSEKSPIGILEKAIEAARRSTAPRRKEFCLNRSEHFAARYAAGWRPGVPKKAQDHTLRTLVGSGLTLAEIAARTGYTRARLQQRLRALGLMDPPRPRLPEPELKALLQQGLWPSQIAAKTGRTVSAINLRKRRLRQRGVAVPRPLGPTPNAKRRVSDEQIIAMVQTGIRLTDMARKAGIAAQALLARLRGLRRRGVLPAPAPIIRVPDEPIIALAQQGFGAPTIGRRLGLSLSTVTRRLRSLQRRGLLPPTRRVPDGPIITLAHEGLGARKIGRRLGLSPNTVQYRLRSLRRRRLLPPPTPIVCVPDEPIIALAQEGISAQKIARHLGRNSTTILERLRSLRQRGLLPPPAPIVRVPDEPIIALAQQGFGAPTIGRRLSMSRRSVGKRLNALRQRGLLAPRKGI